MEKHEICKLIIQQIQSYLSSPDCLEAHREKNHFVRKRKLSMSHIVTYLLYTSRASMNTNIDQIREVLPQIAFPEVSKQAVSKARQYINPSLFSELFNLSVDSFYRNLDSRKTWHGYHIYAVDGSRLEIPNSRSTFDFFGEMFTYPHKDRKFTSGLASIIYDVLEDYIVHASLARYLASERTAAIRHMETLTELNLYENSVIIFDRGYYSDEMFRYCVTHGHLCLMRIKEAVKLSKSCHGDTICSLSDGTSEDNDVKVRVIEVLLDDGSKEYLATNLFDKSITKEMFRELYFLRWPVEVKYFELKERFRLEEYNGTTATSVIQEFYINILLSNLTALIKAKVDDDINIALSTSRSKHRYQANRTFIIGKIRILLAKLINGILNPEAIDSLVKACFKVRSQIQPGRKFRRKRKLVCRKHFPNIKSAY